MTGRQRWSHRQERNPVNPHPIPFTVRPSDHAGKASGPTGWHFIVHFLKLIPQNENFLIIFSFAPYQEPLTTSFAMPLEGFRILKQHARAKAKTKSHCALLESSLLEGWDPHTNRRLNHGAPWKFRCLKRHRKNKLQEQPYFIKPGMEKTRRKITQATACALVQTSWLPGEEGRL